MLRLVGSGLHGALGPTDSRLSKDDASVRHFDDGTARSANHWWFSHICSAEISRPKNSSSFRSARR